MYESECVLETLRRKVARDFFPGSNKIAIIRRMNMEDFLIRRAARRFLCCAEFEASAQYNPKVADNDEMILPLYI